MVNTLKRTALVCFVSTGLSLTSAGQDQLEWSETRRLTVNDFKADPPDPSSHQSLIAAFGFEVNLKKEEIQNLSTFNHRVTNRFSPKNSWIDWRDKSRLRYAITLFDLNEWMARELRKRLNANRAKVLSGDYQSIQEEVQTEFQMIRQEYDNDSNFGNHAPGQMNWETRISERLAALGEFCKSCD
jgi:hypothetical protein